MDCTLLGAGVTAWKRRNVFIPAILVLLMSTRNKPALRNILVNWNVVRSCAAKYLSDWKSRIQRNRALWWLRVVPSSSFSLHTNQRKTICAACLRAGPQEGTFLRDAAATLGLPLSMGRSAPRMTHMCSSLPHRGRDTGLHTVPTLHGTSLCLLTSQPCPPCPCPPHPCPPHPRVCPLPLCWKQARLTDHHTNPNSYAGRNDIVPSVKICFTCGSIFSLLLRGGDGSGGDHRPAGLAGAYRHFSRSGSSSQLPRRC